jgi:cold shock CspA family protein
MRCTGVVTVFWAGRLYGWILPDGERVSIFVHSNDTHGKVILREGDRVEFTKISTKKGDRAVDVKILVSAPAKVGV